MKKLLPLLTFAFLIAFGGSSLYIFNLPPFHPAAPEKIEQKQPEKAPEVLTEPKVTRAKSYDEYMSRGQLFEKNNYASLAINEYEQASKLDPAKTEPYLKIARIQVQNGDFPKALEIYNKALALDANNPVIKIEIAKTWLKERKISEAQNLLNGLTAENQSLKYYQGILAAYSGDYEKSKNLLKRSMEIGGDASLSKNAQNFLNAYHEFDSYQDGQKNHLKTLLGRSFDQGGEFQMAIALLFEVVKEQRDYRDAWIILGHSYLNIQKYQDALEALIAAKKLDPKKPETLFFLGLSYYGLNDFTQASANLEQAKKFGFQPGILINQKLAEIYLQQKKYQQAASNFEAVVSLNDHDINYYIKPIWLYLELKQPEKALQLAQKALKNHPNEAMGYNLLAWAQIGSGAVQEAEKNLKTALKINPNLDAVYLNYGLLEEKRGKLKEAMVYYKKAHEMGQGDSISNNAAERYNGLINQIKNSGGETFKANIFNP
jgi:tetratricopeptide (TPR) repeat protein